MLNTGMAAIGLTPAHIDAVKEAWALLEQDLKGHGVNLFVK